MNEYTEKKMRALIGMMKHTNLSKEEIIAICGCLEDEQMADDIAEMLRKNKHRLKEIPHQEMMNLCGHIIIKYKKPMQP